MKFAAPLAAAALAAAFAAPASAQFAKAEDAIKYRQSALFVMGQHFGRIGAMANGRIPYDAKAAVDNAEVVAAVAKLPWAGFGAGTEQGRDTRAKPEIWLDPAKFKEHQDKLKAEAPKLLAAARTNNLENQDGVQRRGGHLQGLPRRLPQGVSVGPRRFAAQGPGRGVAPRIKRSRAGCARTRPAR